MTQEALKLALEALERSVATCFGQYAHQQVMSQPDHFINQAITAIKEALREHAMREVQRLGQEIEQEPVAWEQFYPDIGKPQLTHPPQGIYYTPPQRTWVGLTEEEYAELAEEFGPFPINQIEAKLKEKNT